MFATASSAAATPFDSFLPETYSWSTASNDTPSPTAYADVEQTWFTIDADVLGLSSLARSSLSPPLTSTVSSLYLPLSAVTPPLPDESDSTDSSTIPSNSPPPQLPADESEAAPTVLAFPAPRAPSLPLSVAPYLLSVSRKRGRANAEERAARVEHKRRRHRAIDLARRQRETTAVQQLSQLTATADRRAVDDERRDKVGVLEQAVQQLADLQQLVAHLTHANNAQQDQLNAARFQLQQRQSALAHVDDMTRAHSVYSSAFLSSSLSLCLVSVSSGLVLDANARLFHTTGWQRHHVIGRMLTVPYEHLITRTVCPSERQQRQQQRLLVEDRHGQMVPSPQVQQYETGRQAIVDVASGARAQVYSVWRLHVRSGRLYELPGSCWAGELEDVEEGEGEQLRRYRRPQHIIFAFSFSEAIMID